MAGSSLKRRLEEEAPHPGSDVRPPTGARGVLGGDEGLGLRV